MPAIRPDDLPAAVTVPADAALIIDNGLTVEKATPLQVMNAARSLASQAEAEAGADNVKVMSALRVKQAIDAQAVSVAILAADAGAGLIGFSHDETYPAGTLGAKASNVVHVKDAPWNAVGDNVADDYAAIQACFDDNPNATIDFRGGNYKSSAGIILVDALGRDFQGDIIGGNATITFTTDGSATDDDPDMEKGFIVYPANNGTGGDISGLRQSKVSGLTINGPLNGAGFYLANSQDVLFEKIYAIGNRYGIVNECCINTGYIGCTFEDYTNAGVGLTMTNNPDVWYRSPNAYWNDSPTFINCGFKNGLQTQPLAHILDHGSLSESTRTVIGCYFYSRWDGYVGSMISTQYGILSRSGNWSVKRSWFENTSYHIRILDAASVEGTGNVSGVAGAQPDGTYSLTNFPDGYSYNLDVDGCWFARPFDAVTFSGVRNRVNLNGNVCQFILNGGVVLKSIGTSTTQVVMDDGVTILSPVGSYGYSSLVGGVLINTAAQLTTWAPTVSASSGTITTSVVNNAKYEQRGKTVMGVLDITITTNGTGAGTIGVTTPVTAATNGGAVWGRESAIAGKGLCGGITGAGMVITYADATYPGADGARFVMAFQYEAA